jgi:hypothetical protein
MKKIHRKRLAALTLALLRDFKAKKLVTPKGKAIEFNMAAFASDGAINYWNTISTIPPRLVAECGTSCCFLGYAPLIFTQASKIKKWSDVCRWVTGFHQSNRFNFLFGPYWPAKPKQAAQRALFLIENPKATRLPQSPYGMKNHPEIRAYRRLTKKELQERLETIANS